MNSLLATRMRERRLELHLSQSELAQGLCEQAKISRIEQGEICSKFRFITFAGSEIRCYIRLFL